MNAAMWVSYFAIVIIFTWYFKKDAMHPYSRTFVDGLIMANGISAILTMLAFVWLLPEFAHLSPVYPGPETLVSILISMGDGVRIGQVSQAQRPVVLDSTTLSQTEAAASVDVHSDETTDL